MKYKKFTLDKFQEDSIHSFLKNHSVVVSAATGTGKTLIADYIIDTEIERGKRVIYTAPIKALSNQKYSQFKKEYGKDKIGIMTGDVVINPGAPILIMTTEIYRNMLMTNDPSIMDVSYIIFDEIHFLSDFERGTVWEESIIFSPDHMRFLCLSATIPNADEFARWIEKIKHHPVDVIKYSTRAVPLHHYLFDIDLGITDIPSVQQQMELDRYPSHRYATGRSKKRRQDIKAPFHLDLIEDLADQNLTPTIYFVFGRASCETKAKELSKQQNFLSKRESKDVAELFNSTIRASSNSAEITSLKTTSLLSSLVQKGIAFHHAGVLPILKEIIEQLFERGLIHVLYATETFAVGINMPAKVVCFDSLEKYDGRSFRYLFSKEYFQLAGRAGRRGIDKEGKSIAMVNRRFADLNKIKNITDRDKDPITSQFRLSYNSVLNMRKNHNQGEIDILLKSNFGCYQQKGRAVAMTKASFSKKERILTKMGYMKGKELTTKGEFATHIYSNELIVSEIFGNKLYKELDNFEMVLLVNAIMYEERKNDSFKIDTNTARTENIRKMLRYNSFLTKSVHPNALKRIAFITWKWVGGCEFSQLMTHTNLLEGDLIRMFRQCIDLFKQIKKAAHGVADDDLIKRCDSCIDSIRRGFIEFEL